MASMANEIFVVSQLSIAEGPALNVVSESLEYEVESDLGGFNDEQQTLIVVTTNEFKANYPKAMKDYLQEIAVVSDQEFRIKRIKEGQVFVELTLETIQSN
jgi:hypothetical protein